MSTTPIPSPLVEDFKLNVEDFDAFSNGTGQYTDRFGSARLSLSQFMESIGYEVPVAFTTGLSITRVTQTVTNAGNTFHARADAIPFTTTGVFNSAQWDLIVSNPVEIATHSAASKTTPVDADEIPLVDSAASFGLKRLTWSNLKATLKTWLQGLNGVIPRSTNTILDATNYGATISATSTFTQTITAAATLGNGWWCEYRNNGTGLITIDPNAAETIDGVATIVLMPGESTIIVCDGSGFITVGRRNRRAGTSIASASTVNLTTATADALHITGTTTITAWTMNAGQITQVIFDGVLTLTHNATTNNLPGAANITTTVGDRAMLYYDGATTYVLNYQRADGTPLVGQRMLLTSQVASTSGTAVDFTGIPSWAKKITILLDGVSSNGSSIFQVQLGTSSGVENSGYSTQVFRLSGTALTSGASATSGFSFQTNNAPSDATSGRISLLLHFGTTWGVDSMLTTAAAFTQGNVGQKTLSGVLDRVRITTINGTDIFDAGGVAVMIEGY